MVSEAWKKADERRIYAVHMRNVHVVTLHTECPRSPKDIGVENCNTLDTFKAYEAYLQEASISLLNLNRHLRTAC